MRVSGTACAMSAPTTRTSGARGYSTRSAVTPIEPAPTEEIDTKTPRNSPSATVNAICRRSLNRSMADATRSSR